jgi:hypothetical protein
MRNYQMAAQSGPGYQGAAHNFAGLTDFKLKSTSQWLGQHRGKIHEIVGKFM